MLISVLAFRKPPKSDQPALSKLTNDLTDNLIDSPITITVEDVKQREDETVVERPSSRRSRGMTIAQVLPLFTSSVPVRAGVTLPPIDLSNNRRHSLGNRIRNCTISTEPPSRQPVPISSSRDFQRTRAKTIAVPPSTLQRFGGSFERIRSPINAVPLAPIASTEESSEEEKHSSPSSSSSSSSSSLPLPLEQMELFEEPLEERHWLFNGRFLLFCFSNFASTLR